MAQIKDLNLLEIVEMRYLPGEVIIRQVKCMKESQVSNRGSNWAQQALGSEVECGNSPWVLLAAFDALPLAIGGAGVPIGREYSLWIVGDGTLEIKQREHVRTVPRDRGATNAANSISEQQPC